MRCETPQDAAAIHALTQRAFAGAAYAGGDEGDVIDRLRSAGALLLSLVATDEDDRLLGQVSFSRATEDGGSAPWCALGPVSVEPSRQSEGVGAMLIRAGLDAMRTSGQLGCILTGNPAYYARFGFMPAAQHAPSTEPAEYFQLLRFGEATPRGRFAFHAGFYGDDEETSS